MSKKNGKQRTGMMTTSTPKIASTSARKKKQAAALGGQTEYKLLDKADRPSSASKPPPKSTDGKVLSARAAGKQPAKSRAPAGGLEGTTTLSPSAVRKQPAKALPRAGQKRKTTQSERKGRQYKLHPISAKTTSKWSPLSKESLEHVKTILDNSLRVVMSSERRSRDSEEQLLNLRDEFMVELLTVVAPLAPPKRRKLRIREMEDRNRRDEQTLFETYREIRTLETHLEEQQELIDDGEEELAYFDGLVVSSEAREKHFKALHPVLRQAIDERKDQPASAVTVEIRKRKWAMMASSPIVRKDGAAALDDESEDDDGTNALAEQLCSKLERVNEQMCKFRQWMSATHEIAVSLE
eukprot:m.213838 g.213838  ORF g.213838 m.213838 type:complete len:353 (-) comp25573_c1_seq1:1400-2458(-)